ncbi:MAG: Stp1/IreP family PP2C-type Ser/Thr phosphatase [Candidatus Wallbacteria bacterium]
MKFIGACKTDIGKKKQNNEDSFFFSQEQGIFLIADGMGGHAGGEIASDIAVKTIQKMFDNVKERVDKIPSIEKFIESSVLSSSALIKKETIARPELTGMGTTIVMCFALNEKIYVANVGDSRCYILTAGGDFRLLSKDHSQIQELIDRRIITEEQAKKHPLRHVITQAVGYNDTLDVRIVDEDYRPNDYYLLCSDGLNDHFESDAEIKELLKASIAESNDDLELAAQKLVDKANELGGRDNITVMIFKTLE